MTIVAPIIAPTAAGVANSRDMAYATPVIKAIESRAYGNPCFNSCSIICLLERLDSPVVMGFLPPVLLSSFSDIFITAGWGRNRPWVRTSRAGVLWNPVCQTLPGTGEWIPAGDCPDGIPAGGGLPGAEGRQQIRKWLR